jgi:DNA-directed RNA polymerase III subunit RPC11
MRRKEVDDVLGGDEMWKHADATTGTYLRTHHHRCTETDDGFTCLAVTCDKCSHNRAYFYQLQIRSADEPMTTCEHVLPAVEHYPYAFSFQSTGVFYNDVPATRD